MYKKDMAILIVSCDKYADLWDIFLPLKNKYWKQCEYVTYIGSNYKKIDERECSCITIGEDKTWTENTLEMLKKINHEYVLMLLEDHFIIDYVDNEKIDKLLQYAIKENTDCLRVYPSPRPCNVIDKELGIGEVKLTAPYCISTMPAIWRKDSLMKLLEIPQSAWEFEQVNSKNALNSSLNIKCTIDPCINICNGVERGKWYSSTVKLLENNGIYVDISKRGVINNDGLWHKLYGKIYVIIQNFRAKYL